MDRRREETRTGWEEAGSSNRGKMEKEGMRKLREGNQIWTSSRIAPTNGELRSSPTTSLIFRFHFRVMLLGILEYWPSCDATVQRRWSKRADIYHNFCGKVLFYQITALKWKTLFRNKRNERIRPGKRLQYPTAHLSSTGEAGVFIPTRNNSGSHE